MGNTGTESQVESTEGKDNENDESAGGDQQCAGPGIFGGDGPHFRPRHDGCEMGRTTHPLDFGDGLTLQLMQFTGVAERVATAIPDLHAQAVDLEGVSVFGRILLSEQRTQIAKKGFTREMSTE